MRTWKRALGPLRCGKCTRDIPAGAAYVTVETLLAPLRKFTRCAGCAGEPVPADLAAAVPVALRPTLLTRFDADSLPLDFRQDQPPAQTDTDEELPLAD